MESRLRSGPAAPFQTTTAEWAHPFETRSGRRSKGSPQSPEPVRRGSGRGLKVSTSWSSELRRYSERLRSEPAAASGSPRWGLGYPRWSPGAIQTRIRQCRRLPAPPRQGEVEFLRRHRCRRPGAHGSRAVADPCPRGVLTLRYPLPPHTNGGTDTPWAHAFLATTRASMAVKVPSSDS